MMCVWPPFPSKPFWMDKIDLGPTYASPPPSLPLAIL